MMLGSTKWPGLWTPPPGSISPMPPTATSTRVWLRFPRQARLQHWLQPCLKPCPPRPSAHARPPVHQLHPPPSVDGRRRIARTGGTAHPSPPPPHFAPPSPLPPPSPPLPPPALPRSCFQSHHPPPAPLSTTPPNLRGPAEGEGGGLLYRRPSYTDCAPSGSAARTHCRLPGSGPQTPGRAVSPRPRVR